MRPVFFNFQGSALLGFLAFLGFATAEAGALATALVLIVRRRTPLARRVLLAALVGAGAYLAALLGFSAASREQVAERGEEKYFCEVDCHLAYSVEGVARTRSLGSGPERRSASWSYRVVTLRVRFDEHTISARRPWDLRLEPSSRNLRVVDARGRIYHPDPAGQRALERVEGAQTPLTRTLLPGETYRTKVVFDLPEDAPEPRLDAAWLTRLLIGHENSPFHRKTSFRLGSSAPSEQSRSRPRAPSLGI